MVDVVEPNFFQVIKLPLVAGDPAEIFRHPESVVLSESAARKYFGNADPIGKTLTDAKGKCAARRSRLPRHHGAADRHGSHARPAATTPIFPETYSFPIHRSSATTPMRRRRAGLIRVATAMCTLAPGTNPQSVIAKMAPMLDRALGPQLKSVRPQCPRQQGVRAPYDALYAGSPHLRITGAPS